MPFATCRQLLAHPFELSTEPQRQTVSQVSGYVADRAHWPGRTRSLCVEVSHGLERPREAPGFADERLRRERSTTVRLACRRIDEDGQFSGRSPD
jgi:hypothetical protein